MSRIRLSEGYSVIPEGQHIFQIVEVNHDETFGKIEVKLAMADGKTHVEKYNLVDKNGNQSEGAIKAFSYFARAAMDDMSLMDIDPQDLVGHFVEATVVHDKVQSKDDPNKILTFVKLDNKRHATGFESSAFVDNLNDVSTTTVEKPVDPLDILKRFGV